MFARQDVCVKKDFDDLYNKLTDEGRELKVIHGGVVEVSHQPVTTARNITHIEHPFGVQLPQQKPAPEPEQQEVLAPTTQEETQVYGFISSAG